MISSDASSSPALPLREGERSGDSAGKGSPYAQAEFRAVDCMRVIREYITQLDALSPSDDQTLRNDLLLRVREADNQLRRIMIDVKRCAGQEQRTKEFKEVQRHCTSTQALVKAHYTNRSTQPVTVFQLHDGEADGEHGSGGVAPEAPYDLHQDVEFADFFARTKERDEEMDVALDRIHEGVLRVNDNARGIRDELHIQQEVMHETDVRVEENQGQMAKMNRKMQKAIKKLGKSRLITYCVMCVIVVVLIIVIILLAKSL